jgi:hypothetical protein
MVVTDVSGHKVGSILNFQILQEVKTYEVCFILTEIKPTTNIHRAKLRI